MTDENFVHLHNHSSFSLLDGLSSVKTLASCASSMGYKSLALTDHGSCAGLFQFTKACKEFNLKPILGMEAYTCKDHSVKDKDSRAQMNHLVILAKNKIGYKNLIYLSSFGYLKGFYYKPRIDFNELQTHSEGLIISSACGKGEIPNLLWTGNEEAAIATANKYKELLKDDFYLEIMIHAYNDAGKEQEEKERKIANMVYKLGRKLGIKVIATQDTHYARKEDWEAHDVLLSIQTIDVIKNPERFTFDSKDFYLKPYEEMLELYKKAPDVLVNTVEISEKIETNLLSFGEDLLPKFIVPEGFKDEEAFLKTLVSNGMKEKGLFNVSAYRERIKYEMSVIVGCKYTKYFLVLWDIINFARREGIRIGVGRGSAVSSLCLYVLGITGLDPLKYDLIFERFLNPERISPPDVDVDFDYDRRDEVFNYIVRKYGEEYCCQIGTYNKLKARAAIRGTAKALDIGNDWEDYQEKLKKDPDTKEEMTKNSLNMADAISKQIPFKPTMTIELALKSSSDFRDSMRQFPKLLDCSRRIEKTLASAGVHPAGILICKDKVIERVPLRESKGVIASQFDGPEVEKLGLLKFDLLALKTLTVIDKTVKMIKLRYNRDINVDTLDPVDKEVFKILNGRDPTKDTLGIFQFEADGMSRLLEAVRVDRFEDMIVACALYRPGPLGAGMHDMYCNYKHGRKKVEYLHPLMGEALKETYGIMVYQENIMRVSQKMAGFTGGQADTLRKAVGKKDKDLLAQTKKQFVDGCVKNDIKEEIAIKVFAQIEYFGDYGFNKSHSAAYAFIAYQTAWLKCYYPIEFMCNLLTSEINNNDKNEKLNMYIHAAERMGITCSHFDVNNSELEFKIGKLTFKNGQQREGLIKPLTMLKGVGSKAVESIVKNQPFKDLEDFMARTDARVVNCRVFETMVKSGCMGSWGVPQAIMLTKYPEIKKSMEKDKKIKQKQEKEMEKFGGLSLMDEFGATERITI